MTAERYSLDTNLLVYAIDLDAGEKHRLAADLVERASRWDCVLTLQALAEFFSATTRKGKMPLATAAAQVRDWQIVFPLVTPRPGALDRAVTVVEEHHLSFWDALLWAVVRDAGVTTLLTEDFQHGRTLEGVTFRNPFLDPP